MSKDSGEVVFSQVGSLGRIVLNRPKFLNALNLNMVGAIQEKLNEWNENPKIGGIVIEGRGEKAFCAGGDIKRLAQSAMEGNLTYCREFFSTEFLLNRNIYRLEKPWIAILDGITMGGGVGLSVHGRFQVATENTIFAMPETGIGYFPDVGASYFLSRLPSEIGTFLGLTGARLNGRDMLELGIASHYIDSEKLDEVLLGLRALPSGEGNTQYVYDLLEKFSLRDKGDFVSEHQEVIRKCFSKKSVEDIFAALEQIGSEWAEQILASLRGKCPRSLKVTLRQLTQGRTCDFENCMIMELRLAVRFMKEPDFYEGVRAMLVDKDFKPSWRALTLDAITDEEVERFFQPLIDGDLTFS